MTYAVIPDDGDRTVEFDGYSFPTIPPDLTAEQASAMWAEVEASEALPDHVKEALGQRLNQRLDEIAGRSQPPRPVEVIAGVFFIGATPEEVERERKSLSKAAWR